MTARGHSILRVTMRGLQRYWMNKFQLTDET